jgi:molybdopterin molybdotransferase
VRPVSFEEARRTVIERVRDACADRHSERVPLLEACGRVLARDAAADRDYPAAAQSIRDGFAVRSGDTPGRLRMAGEVRAGEAASHALAAGEAIEIMTGAPVPQGADAVVMVEHVTREDDFVRIDSAAPRGQFINPRGAEAACGETLAPAGKRLDYSDIAMLATIGAVKVDLFTQPRVAILPTGDEIVDLGAIPLDHQVRNSNAYSLAAQVRRAGGIPELLPVARDEFEHTRALVERGLRADLLLLSGGVSAGKYDIVEHVLAALDAEFFFDRVLIQPGQPLVFGRARGRFFFGLPGNPASTMVTFEIFARAAVALLSGECQPELRRSWARLTDDFRHKPGLTRFLPARLSEDGTQLTPLRWRGSSDVPALTRANSFLIAHPDREQYRAGDLMEVLPK